MITLFVSSLCFILNPPINRYTRNRPISMSDRQSDFVGVVEPTLLLLNFQPEGVIKLK